MKVKVGFGVVLMELINENKPLKIEFGNNNIVDCISTKVETEMEIEVLEQRLSGILILR
ncbi:leucine-rich repeat transmembrane protein kinase family protein [Artemisia annua]|uniref:Leucine-rich repeat transmembrane protein kinase family protein n=1 Tax=Artemisia annua TaxID=35608 RepID=A0A2U1MPM2_ARTAN|nr:leucine-rich repeat transmembrane protein kinase family protein [Artemisia annua]